MKKIIFGIITLVLIMPSIANAITVDPNTISTLDLGVACDDFGDPFPLFGMFCFFVAVLLLICVFYFVDLLMLNKKISSVSSVQKELPQNLSGQTKKLEANKIKIKKRLFKILIVFIFFVGLFFIFNWLSHQRWDLGCGIYNKPGYNIENDNYDEIYQNTLDDFERTNSIIIKILLVVGGISLIGFIFIIYYIRRLKILYPAEVLPDGKKKFHSKVEKMEILRGLFILFIILVIVLLIIFIPIAAVYLGAY